MVGGAPLVIRMLLDLDAARAELAEYASRGYPIFVAEDDVLGVIP